MDWIRYWIVSIRYVRKSFDSRFVSSWLYHFDWSHLFSAFQSQAISYLLSRSDHPEHPAHDISDQDPNEDTDQVPNEVTDQDIFQSPITGTFPPSEQLEDGGIPEVAYQNDSTLNTKMPDTVGIDTPLDSSVSTSIDYDPSVEPSLPPAAEDSSVSD
jgi:hypothetical protein